MRNKVRETLAIPGLAALAALLLATAGCGSGSSSASGNIAAMPTFSPGAGTYNASQTVTIADSTSGAVLYCTTDGSTPTTSSPKCAQPTTVYQTEFLQAIAVAPGGSPSAVASGAYTIDLSAAATPTFSPAGGSYASPQAVTIADATTGVNIYYTTDGSTPSASSTLYTGPITVSATETLSAIAVASGYSNSGIASATYNITTPVATPAFSVPSGSYTTAQTVAITDATPNAAIYYTTDGSTPSATSTAYTAPISVSQTQTISAIAVLNGQSSAIAVAAYTIGQTAPALAAPVFSLAAGTYTSAQTVSISVSTANASIFYTTDGSVPTASSTAYSAPITVTTTETISAIAVLAGDSSAVVTATYTISVPVAAPVFSVPSGSYTAAQTVTLTDATPNAAIYYTLDGSTPTASSTAYTAPIAINTTETITAIAILGASDSAVVNAAYVIVAPVIAAPVFSIPAGSYTSAQTVTITDATPNTAVYYTTNGSTPTASSTAYIGPITVSQTQTISAIAVLGTGSSSVTTAAYTISVPVATPVFSVPTGNYTAAQNVTITDATPNASIYYAINNTAPTTASTPYTAAINVTQTQTISAIAVVGANASAVATVAYTVGTSVAPPTFTPASGSPVVVGQTVTIADGDATATIYYTLNGATPTAASTKYTAPVALTTVGAATIDAVAIDGATSSPVSIATYTVRQAVPAPTFTPASGSALVAGKTVTIADTDAAATIYYTLDGSTPTVASTKYTAAVALSTTGSVTVNAIAIDAGLDSTVATAIYTVSPASVPAPTFTPATGASLTAGQTVTITDTDATATIYYTTDGSAPSAASPKYTAPFALSTPGAATVNAIAVDGATSSTVAAATYTVSPATVPAPTFTPATGASLTVGQTVTIADTDTAAIAYYTIDGSTPTAASTKYVAPFTLSTAGAATVKAIAIDGATSSAVATANYTVVGAGPSISVTVLSGAAKVVGASVQLYAAGMATGDAGYGSAPTALLATAATTNGSGLATVSFTCPATPATGALVYLVGSGGDATGNNANNTGLEMMTALGPCANLTSGAAYTINEATTVASAYALSPFMTTAPNVGSSTANYSVGLTNAFATVNNLVDVTTGAVLAHTPAYTQTFAQDTNIVNNSTVPTARINTLADMLNSCTSTDGSGSGCSSLFSAAPASSGTAPTNTLQAILNIAQNPGANVGTLYGLATGAFTPTLGGAPNDWTLALTFTGGGLGMPPNPTNAITYTYTSGGVQTTNPLAIVNTGLAIDGAGNIWVTAYADDDPVSTGFLNSQATLLAEFNNLGGPVTPATAISAGTVTFGGFDPEPASNDTDALAASAIDEAGNVWVGDNEGFLLEVSPSLTVTVPVLGQTPPQAAEVYSVAIDASANVWVGTSDGLYKFDNAGNLLFQSPGSAPYQELSSLVFDSNSGLWAAEAMNSSIQDVYQISTTDGSVAFDFYNGAGFYDVTLSADGSGNVYGCGDPGGQTLDVYIPGTVKTSYDLSATGRGCGTQLVLDGQGHLFAVSNVNAASVEQTVDEYTTLGVLISPVATGFTGTSAGEQPTLNPDTGVFGPVPGVGAAIDPSGNLWVLNNDTNGPTASGNVLVEFIGIAAPVATPTSVALKSGQLGLRP